MCLYQFDVLKFGLSLSAFTKSDVLNQLTVYVFLCINKHFYNAHLLNLFLALLIGNLVSKMYIEIKKRKIVWRRDCCISKRTCRAEFCLYIVNYTNS